MVGVDLSGGMIAEARRAVEGAGLTNVELVRSDATALAGLPEASFDVVLCSAGLLYLPVDAAPREWRRLLVADGLLGFSTMRAGFPVAARLFRDHARAFGLTLPDPSAPLGTADRCRRILRAAGFVPDRVVAERVRFSRSELSQAWEIHLHRPRYRAVADLPAEDLRALRDRYRADLARLLSADERAVTDAEVLYAFGRPARRPGADSPR